MRWVNQLLCVSKSNQKHPRCKKGRPKTKTGLAEKRYEIKWAANASWF